MAEHAGSVVVVCAYWQDSSQQTGGLSVTRMVLLEVIMLIRRIVMIAPLALLAACSDAGQSASSTGAPGTVTQTVTETVTATTEVTVTVESTPTEEPVEGAETTDTESSATSDTVTGPGVVLPPDSRPLGLDDFFNPSSSWEEGRWNVATKANEQGVSTEISYFDEEQLELRLQNQFASLRFEAGQANDSMSSDCVTKVDIFVDGELRETREFEFNVIQEFDEIDVADSNAVVLAVSNSECGDSARVVLSRIEVD